MEVQHGEGQCDCPASSAYELAPEAPSIFQSLCMYLTCTHGGSTSGGTSADVSTLLSPSEWRRRQEEGEGEEGEFLGRGSVGSVSEVDGSVGAESSGGDDSGDSRSVMNRLCNPFRASTSTSSTARSRAASNSSSRSSKDYVTYSTLTTDADESDGDVELGDLELTTHTTTTTATNTSKGRGKNKGADGRLSPIGTAATAPAAVSRGGCGCGQGNCKCGANCRCGEVAKPKLPRVR